MPTFKSYSTVSVDQKIRGCQVRAQSYDTFAHKSLRIYQSLVRVNKLFSGEITLMLKKKCRRDAGQKRVGIMRRRDLTVKA